MRKSQSKKACLPGEMYGSTGSKVRILNHFVGNNKTRLRVSKNLKVRSEPLGVHINSLIAVISL